jgi:para-nitrobenzyl esterase
VRDATSLGKASPQGPQNLIPECAVLTPPEAQSEDCLYLNVWTPGTSGKRPVMVWFHGGGYAAGSGGIAAYDGANLARRHDVVVVTVNHRLNGFGYLYLGELGGPRYADSGAAGLLDLVQSLQWVRDNIAAFGGDPGAVTIFGESGGGRKVSNLLASPAARGLFHRAIAQSGVGITSPTAEAGTRSARAVMQQLGLAAGEVDKLQQVSTAQLLAALQASGQGGVSPVIDGRTLPANGFEPTATTISAQVPLLLGSNLTETTFFPDTPTEPIDDATLTQRLKGYTRADDAAVAGLIALYRSSRPAASNTYIYQLISSDFWLTEPVTVQAERKAALKAAPVFVYQFRKPTPVRQGKLNVPHTSEIPYIFHTLEVSADLVGRGPDRQALAEKMSTAWTNFARTGDPGGGSVPQWPSYSAERRAVMAINDAWAVELDPHRQERLAVAAARAPQARAALGGTATTMPS